MSSLASAETTICCTSGCRLTPTDIATSGGVSVVLGSEVLGINSYSALCKTELLVINIDIGVTSVGASTFSDSPILLAFDSSAALITSIEASAFSGCVSLSTVFVPSVTSVGPSAFYNCRSLASVDFPLLTVIANQTFYHCLSLLAYSGPAVSIVGTSAFAGCTALINISFPIATQLGDYSFEDAAVVIPVIDAVTFIGEFAFTNALNLTTLTIPSATEIQTFAFYRTSSLHSLRIDSATIIATEAFAESHLISAACYNNTIVGSTAYHIVNCVDHTSTTTVTSTTTSTTTTSEEPIISTATSITTSLEPDSTSTTDAIATTTSSTTTTSIDRSQTTRIVLGVLFSIGLLIFFGVGWATVAHKTVQPTTENIKRWLL